MFSKLPKRNSANHLIFQPEFTVFPCIKMVSTPCWSRKKKSCAVRKLTNTTKAIHVQLIAVIARALWLATVLYTLVFTLEPIPTPGLSRLRLSGLGTRWWSRRPGWKESVVFQETFEVTVVESNCKINFLGLLLYTGYKMIKKGQRSVSINAGTVAHVAAVMTIRFSRRLFRLPFAACHLSYEEGC